MREIIDHWRIEFVKGNEELLERYLDHVEHLSQNEIERLHIFLFKKNTKNRWVFNYQWFWEAVLSMTHDEIDNALLIESFIK